VVDDQHFDWRPARFELETKLFLHSRKDADAIVSIPDGEIEHDAVSSLEASPIQNQRVGVIGENAGELRQSQTVRPVGFSAALS
jgi:hypothetical protein